MGISHIARNSMCSEPDKVFAVSSGPTAPHTRTTCIIPSWQKFGYLLFSLNCCSEKMHAFQKCCCGKCSGLFSFWFGRTWSDDRTERHCRERSDGDPGHASRKVLSRNAHTVIHVKQKMKHSAPADSTRTVWKVSKVKRYETEETLFDSEHAWILR